MEVGVSLLISILLASFGQNTIYVTQLLPPESNASRGPAPVAIIMTLGAISCLSELVFRAYLHFSDPNATSYILISTSSVLFLTFTHIIGFLVGVVIFIFNLPFDMAIVSLGVHLILKSLFFPICLLLGSNAVGNIIEEDVVYIFSQIDNLKVKVHDLYSKFISLFQSNQIQPLNE